MKHIFIDVHPDYQPNVNWKLLKDAGVVGVIAKSGAGTKNYPKFYDYIKKAADAGLIVGAYHWLDPIYGAEAQANTLAIVDGYPEVSFTVNDYEQWWSNWAKWYEGIRGNIPMSEVPKFDPYKLGAYLGLFNAAAKKVLKKPHFTYTAKWFLDSYTRNAAAFINDFKLWTANYPYAPGRITLTWEKFLHEYLPAATAKPIVPTGSTLDNIAMWQFTGDKFMLPGVYSDLAGIKPSPLDVNFYFGDLSDFGKKTEPIVECPIDDRLSDIENKVSLLKNSLSDVRTKLEKMSSDLDKLIV